MIRVDVLKSETIIWFYSSSWGQDFDSQIHRTGASTLFQLARITQNNRLLIEEEAYQRIYNHYIGIKVAPHNTSTYLQEKETDASHHEHNKTQPLLRLGGQRSA